MQLLGKILPEGDVETHRYTIMVKHLSYSLPSTLNKVFTSNACYSCFEFSPMRKRRLNGRGRLQRSGFDVIFST